MKIIVNDQELLTLSPLHLKIFAHEINSDGLDSDIKRRLKWVLEHEFTNAFKELKKETVPELAKAGVSSIPLDEEVFVRTLNKLDKYKNVPMEGEPFVVKVNNEELLRFTQPKVNVFTIMVRTDAWRYMRDKLKWVVTHKLDRIVEKMRLEWEPKLRAAGITEVPLSPEGFAELVFKQKGYQDRKARDADALENTPHNFIP